MSEKHGEAANVYTIIAGLAGGGFLAAVVAKIRRPKTLALEDKRSEVETMRIAIEALNTTMSVLTKRLDACEKKHEECEGKHAELESDMRVLRTWVANNVKGDAGAE